jgi:predicted ATPase
MACAACMLVLDNCEHLVGVTAELADRLLKACPGLHILATSREPLGLRGEAVLRVPPLGLPRATAVRSALDAKTSKRPQVPDPVASAAELLFIARAVEVQPSFDVTGDHSTTVQHICRRLDGIPLAIELAAAWIPLLSPTELLARLDDSPSFLHDTGPRRPSPPPDHGRRDPMEL